MMKQATAAKVAGVSTATCLALVVANMIGTGVFASLGFQVAALDGGFVILVLWILGGVLAICGGLSYAELALAMPRSGGEYHLLGRIYHPALGTMAGVASVVVGFSAPVALSATLLGSYVAEINPDLNARVVATAAVVGVTLMHLVTLRMSSVFQLASTLLKLLLIFAFLGFGFLGDYSVNEVRWLPAAGDRTQIMSAAFFVSLMYVMYAYSGWNAVIYILDEVRRPQRSVLWAVVGGAALVMVLYVALNVVFLKSAVTEDYIGRDVVGVASARAIFGEAGGNWMSGLIAVGLVSTISAMVWAGPRVLKVMGEDMRPLRFLSVTKREVPVVAILLQLGLTLTLLWSGTFSEILIYTEFTLALCLFLTVLGLLVLRVRKPGLARPFRCPLFPLPPLLFLGIVGFTLFQVAMSKPWQSALGLLTLGVGLLLHFAAGRRDGWSPSE